MQNGKNLLIRSRMLQITTLLFVVLTFWWAFTKPFDREMFVYQKDIWSSVYVAMSILGGIYGLIISRHFNGHKSLLGRVIQKNHTRPEKIRV